MGVKILSFKDPSRIHPLGTLPSWSGWLAFLGLAILFHLALLAVRLDWFEPKRSPRVSVQTIDPKKLEAIRKKWDQSLGKTQHQSLLIDKNPSHSQATEAPRDARYFSSRNIRVAREQRARNLSPLPKAGTEKRERAPQLSALGIPLRFSHAHPTGESRTASASVDQNTLDSELPEGSDNLLNAQESIFYSFYSRLYSEIAPVWESLIREAMLGQSLQPGNYTTAIEAHLDPHGNLIQIVLLSTSGISALDHAVRLAWNRIERFPNPPRDLLDETGRVRTAWSFTVQVGAGSRLQYLPPARNY